MMQALLRYLIDLVYNLPYNVLYGVPFLETTYRDYIYQEIKAHILHTEKVYLSDMTQLQIVLYTLILFLVVKWIFKFVKKMRKMTFEKFKAIAFRLALYIPQVKAYIDKETVKTIKNVTSKYSKIRKGKTYLTLPENGQ